MTDLKDWRIAVCLVMQTQPAKSECSSDALHSERRQQENGPSVGNRADKDGTFSNTKGLKSQAE